MDRNLEKKITTAVAVAFWAVTREQNHSSKLLYCFLFTLMNAPMNAAETP